MNGGSSTAVEFSSILPSFPTVNGSSRVRCRWKGILRRIFETFRPIEHCHFALFPVEHLGATMADTFLRCRVSYWVFFLLPGLPDWIETSATPPSPRTFFADRRHCQHAAYQFLFVVVVVVVVVRRLPSFADEPAFADVARLFFLVSECLLWFFFVFFLFAAAVEKNSTNSHQCGVSTKVGRDSLMVPSFTGFY